MTWLDAVDLSVLVGKTLVRAERGMWSNGDEVVFVTNTGEFYTMRHEQDCCESVDIEDICGDLADLVGSPIIMAEESCNSTDPPREDDQKESYTWTFYKFATAKGYVTIRWLGFSNGYYSESVKFARDPSRECEEN